MPQLIVEVVADPRKLTKGLGEAEKSTKRFGREMEHTSTHARHGSSVWQGHDPSEGRSASKSNNASAGVGRIGFERR